MRSSVADERTSWLGETVRVFWRALCAPIHAVLAVFEPVVSIVLSAFAVLGLCFSVAFKLLRPQFPFWPMIGVSLSFVALLLLYHGLMRLTSTR